MNQTAPQLPQAKLLFSLFIRCLFICSLSPNRPMSLWPYSHLHWVLATVYAVDPTVCMNYFINCFTSWCLPLATVYKCKVLYLYLLYTVVIILLLCCYYDYFLFYSSIVFGYYCVLFFHPPVVSLTLCASWLWYVFTHVSLCPCYHYSVMLYTVCCLPNGFMKKEETK